MARARGQGGESRPEGPCEPGWLARAATGRVGPLRCSHGCTPLPCAGRAAAGLRRGRLHHSTNTGRRCCRRSRSARRRPACCPSRAPAARQLAPRPAAAEQGPGAAFSTAPRPRGHAGSCTAPWQRCAAAKAASRRPAAATPPAATRLPPGYAQLLNIAAVCPTPRRRRTAAALSPPCCRCNAPDGPALAPPRSCPGCRHVRSLASSPSTAAACPCLILIRTPAATPASAGDRQARLCPHSVLKACLPLRHPRARERANAQAAPSASSQWRLPTGPPPGMQRARTGPPHRHVWQPLVGRVHRRKRDDAARRLDLGVGP